MINLSTDSIVGLFFHPNVVFVNDLSPRRLEVRTAAIPGK